VAGLIFLPAPKLITTFFLIFEPIPQLEEGNNKIVRKAGVDEDLKDSFCSSESGLSPDFPGCRGDYRQKDRPVRDRRKQVNVLCFSLTRFRSHKKFATNHRLCAKNKPVFGAIISFTGRTNHVRDHHS
jgi:hypothetical protein